LVAFAANSLLCRLALRSELIDPAGFTLLRLGSGALVLWLLTRRPAARSPGAWSRAAALFVYAAAFSWAYVELHAGTGALILFGAVQLTMLAAATRFGERQRPAQWLGFALAVGGLVYLVLPGIAAPSPWACVAMATAGAAWGLYSLRGRQVPDPVAATTDAFVRTIPFALALALASAPQLHLSVPGASWAILSGAVTSGLGYVVWYGAVRGLSATRAAMVQLAVPVLAAAGGVVLLCEPLTLRLVLSGSVVLGGVGLAMARSRAST
jgi:drug/metabolite transporter (DMT)-like permease